MKSFKEWQAQDMQAIAQAIEADAGRRVPGLRKALAEAKAGTFAAVIRPSRSPRASVGARPR